MSGNGDIKWLQFELQRSSTHLLGLASVLCLAITSKLGHLILLHWCVEDASVETHCQASGLFVYI